MHMESIELPTERFASVTDWRRQIDRRPKLTKPILHMRMCLSDDHCMFLLVNVERTISPPSTNSSPRQTLNNWPSWSAAHEGRQSTQCRWTLQVQLSKSVVVPWTSLSARLVTSLLLTLSFATALLLCSILYQSTPARCDQNCSKKKKKKKKKKKYWACEKQLPCRGVWTASFHSTLSCFSAPRSC